MICIQLFTVYNSLFQSLGHSCFWPSWACQHTYKHASKISGWASPPTQPLVIQVPVKCRAELAKLYRLDRPRSTSCLKAIQAYSSKSRFIGQSACTRVSTSLRTSKCLSCCNVSIIQGTQSTPRGRGHPGSVHQELHLESMEFRRHLFSNMKLLAHACTILVFDLPAFQLLEGYRLPNFGNRLLALRSSGSSTSMPSLDGKNS